MLLLNILPKEISEALKAELEEKLSALDGDLSAKNRDLESKNITALDLVTQAAQMKAELESQGLRFGLFRSYRQVRTLAAEVSRLAGQALAEANSKKTQLRGELAAMIDELDASLQSARRQLSAVPRGKGLDTVSLRSSLGAAGRQLDQARSNLGSGAYDSGLAAAARAREAINGVFRAIERATGLPASKKR